MKQTVKRILALGLLVSLAAIPVASFAQGPQKTTNEAYGHVGPRHIAKHEKTGKRSGRKHRRHSHKGMRRMGKMHRMDK